jgi:hypothetical protein
MKGSRRGWRRVVASTLMLVALMAATGCMEEDEPTEGGPPDQVDAGPEPVEPDPMVPPPDPAASCDVTAIVDRVWEFASSGSFFSLMLYPDGTYRREHDVDSTFVFCEYGTWSVTGCEIDFDTCHGDSERYQWSATGTTFTLGQSVYYESQLDEEIAFIFCDLDECTK